MDYEQHAKKIRIILRKIAKGLKFLHDRKLVHLDVKPENILLCGDGPEVVLCDFAFSSFVGTENKISGSPFYMAPEMLEVYLTDMKVFKGQTSVKVDGKMDVWSLGIVFSDMFKISSLFDVHRGISDPAELVRMFSNMQKQENPLKIQQLEIDIQKNKLLSQPDKSMLLQGVDLLGRMLIFNPEQRWTIDQVLGHPFFNDPNY